MPLLRDALLGYADRLTEAGVDSPRLSAEVLLAYAIGADRVALITGASRPLTSTELIRAEHFISRRQRGEPVAYITGVREFYDLDFNVTPATLIPRPETEHLVEETEKNFDLATPLLFADLGTGSGALAVTLAVRFPNSRGFALDLSAPALEVARRNAMRHGVTDRIEFLQADFTAALAASDLDLVVCNPPYVSEQEFAALSPEVASFEPKSALVSENEGLEHIAQVLPVATAALRPGGLLLMEIGSGQGDKVSALFANPSFNLSDCVIIPDLAGLDRVVRAIKCG